jgi:hypothetical protein
MSQEVASFTAPLDQFQPGKSAYECVAFGCADINFCGPPGGSPTGNATQIIGLAEYWYARETGSNDSSNTAGMSSGQEYAVLNGLGLRFHPLGGDLLAATRNALAQGLPVLLCGAETGFFDVALGRVPYAWTPSGNHCIVASGLAGNNLYVRDYANSEFFGYRREYDAAKMRLVSATAVEPHWRKQSMIPVGWHDDGKTLTAPNGHKIVLGFRDKVMAGWEASDMPLEEEHAAVPVGTEQIFTRTTLEWTPASGVQVKTPDPVAKAHAFDQIAGIVKQAGS